VEMLTPARNLLLALTTVLVPFGFGQVTATPKSGPEYTADSRLKFPEKFREWIFLTSGIDMSYSPMSGMSDRSVFDNVFVNPEAYQAFVETGTWPDKTTLVLETRGAQTKGSINHSGHYQDSDVMGIEVHVKDEARFPGQWAFFDFENTISGNLVPAGAACYSCHAEHAAVDTTFVQFYPTLLTIAKRKGTLSPAYLKETTPSGR
jgi:hypothetical protein